MKNNLYDKPTEPIAAEKNANGNNGKGTAGMILGILGLIFWIIPIIGLPVNIVGLVFSVKSVNSTAKSQAKAGIVMTIIGLVFTVGNAAIGAYMGATGQLFK